MTHFGDPCIHCGTPHDDVAPGPCTGDAKKAVPVAFRGLGVRWDNVERFRIRFSDGRIEERYAHISESAPYYNFGYSGHLASPPPYDQKL